MLTFVFSSVANALTIGMALFLSAAGLTLLFGILRLLNFAHGTFIMIGAYAASIILGQGVFGTGSFLGAATAAGIVVALLGLVTDLLVFRRLRQFDETSVLIATFALMLALHGAVTLVFGSDFVSVDVPAGLEGAFDVFGVIVPQFSLFLWVVGVATFILVDVLLSRLWVGKMLQSVASDSWVMSVLGHDVKALVTIAVVVSFFLAGFAGGILLPNQTLQPGWGDSLIIQAFAVVVVGGLGSVRGAFVAALLLGAAESVGSLFMPSLALYVGIITILLVRPQGLFPGGGQQPALRMSWPAVWSSLRRQAPTQRPRPRTAAATRMTGIQAVHGSRSGLASPATLVAVGFAALLGLPWWGGGSLMYITSSVLIAGLFAMSWNLLFGHAGLATFGHAGFFAIGAYLAAVCLAADPQAPFLLLLGGAAILGGCVAIPFGVLALRRSQGLQLAILTLAMAEVFRVLCSQSKMLGNDEGLSNIPRPNLGFGALRLPLSTETNYFLFLCVACSCVALVLWGITHTQFGRALRCIKQDPERAAFIGIDVFRYRLLAFVVASAVASMAGALSAPLVHIVTPESASIVKSTSPMLNTLLGGAGTFWGPLLGAATFALVDFGTRTFSGLSDLIVGVTLLVVVLTAPAGMVGFAKAAVPRWSNQGKTVVGRSSGENV